MNADTETNTQAETGAPTNADNEANTEGGQEAAIGTVVGGPHGSDAQRQDAGPPGLAFQPDDAYFDVMADAAANHWWYRTRRAWIRQLLVGRIEPGTVAIDAGTGTAEVVDVLRELGAAPAVGTDYSLLALHYARRRTPTPPVLRSTAEHLPFADGSAHTLVSLEVIEHLDDDLTALAEYKRVLAPGGTLLITVPAYQWLWGDHDVTAAHRRRYSTRQLRNVLTAAGFDVEIITSYFAFLVPPAFLVRRTPLGRLVEQSEDEASTFGPTIDRIFEGLGAAERWIARRHPLPVGLSIACVATKPL